MYKLLRRLSGSVTGRLDREWNDDATSNAPQSGRKRRRDDDDELTGSTSSKKARKLAGRLVNAINEEGESSQDPESPAVPAKETEDVKAMTKGVKDVHLEEKVEDETPKEDSAEQAADATPPPETRVPVQEAKVDSRTLSVEASVPLASSSDADSPDPNNDPERDEGVHVAEESSSPVAGNEETTEDVADSKLDDPTTSETIPASDGEDAEVGETP